MKRIGVFGGTFNPIHNGHLHLARAYANVLRLDLTLLVPTFVPPHKTSMGLLSAQDRLKMCQLAIDGMEKMAVSDIEIRRGGKSYSVDTLHALARKYPQASFYFLMGADMFLTVEEWHDFPGLMRAATLCAAARHEGELLPLRQHAEMLKKKYGARCCIEKIPVLDVSSTRIRKALACGEDVQTLLPNRVQKYIRRNGLYRMKGRG